MYNSNATITFSNNESLDLVRNEIENLEKKSWQYTFELLSKPYKVSDLDNKDKSLYIRINPNNNKEFLPQFHQNVLISKKINNQFNLNLAFQRHLKSTEQSDPLREVSLGQIRSSHHELEVYMRNVEALHFNFDAIRRSDLPGNNTSSIVGLSAEEACQIMRYLGESVKLKYVSFEVENIDVHSAELLSIMIWYLMEGRSMPKHIPSRNENFNCLLVELNESDRTLEFYQSKLNDRWWIKDDAGEFHPCSSSDYDDVIKGNIPDRILTLL